MYVYELKSWAKSWIDISMTQLQLYLFYYILYMYNDYDTVDV